MSALSRFGPSLGRSMLVQHHRHMASASTVSDPIQKLFVDKIREFKNSNKGLDEAHQRKLQDELLRLKRVFQVDDEKKLTQVDHKFSTEVNVNLHDIDESKELRQKIHTGEYRGSLAIAKETKSALLATIPEQVTHDLHLPPLNKPDMSIVLNSKELHPAEVGEQVPDYEPIGDTPTPESIEREMRVHFGKDMPTIHDDKKPERDIVNFPRQPISLDTPPTRYHIIPESWFKFFYSKTGVTGPYVFAGAFGTFLFSKEWLVMEHEMLTAFSSIFIFSVAITKYGPKISSWLRGEMDRHINMWDRWQQGNIETLEFIKQHYKRELSKSAVLDSIYDIRKQDIEQQLEYERRRRIKTIYDDTKRRLNYLVAVADTQRQISHSNMTNWVISNVMSSIGPKLENEVLNNCVANLKRLASQNANTI